MTAHAVSASVTSDLPPNNVRRNTQSQKLRAGPACLAFLLVVAVGAALAGCAHEDKSKPWEKNKKKWYESDMDSGDRSFYHSFFLGN